MCKSCQYKQAYYLWVLDIPLAGTHFISNNIQIIAFHLGSCLEACYWHLIEKRFCYDETIALYEEPTKVEEHFNNNAFDNMAFYDQVALIAGRAIVTIDPLPKQPRAIEHQPVRKPRWWEDNVDQTKKEKPKEVEPQLKVPTIVLTPTILLNDEENVVKSVDEVDKVICKTILKSEPDKVTLRNKSETKISFLDCETKKPCDLVKSATSPNILTPTKSEEPEKVRKKSLRERRMSRSLTLTIDRNVELPVYRHTSMPKFYLDTPEQNQIDSTILMAPSATLTSPVLPRNSGGGFFDLRSIVQLENENRVHQINHPVPVHKQMSPHSRLSQIKERLKSTKLKKSNSATNLPNSIQHI